MASLRIAHITSLYLPILGGRESYIHNVVRNLREFEFDVLTTRVGGFPRSEGRDPRVRIHRLRPTDFFQGPASLTGPSLLTATASGSLSVLRLLRQRALAERLGCDLLHSHWSDVDMMEVLRGRLSDRTWSKLLDKILSAATFRQPTVFTDHSLFAWDDLSEHLRRLLVHALREYRAVLCVEPEGATRAKEMRDATGGTAEVDYLPNSVDTRVFQPRTAPGRRPSTIGYVGRANKGYWLLFDLARRLRDYRFLFVVAGNNRSLKKWREIRSERVTLVENVTPEGLPQVLSQTDLVVSPILANGISRVTLECLAMGIPVVAGGGRFRYPLIDGKTGRLVSPTAEAFAAAVMDLLANESLLLDYGREGRRLVEREFSNDVILPRLAEWYRRLAA